MSIARLSRSSRRRFALGRPAPFVLAAVVLAALLLAAVVPAAASPQESDEPASAAPEEAAAPQETAPVQEEEQAPAAADSHATELDRAQATMGRLLAVGRALHSWARDTRLERGRRQPIRRLPEQARWDRCPKIEHAELEQVLVPAYLRELPAEDAWGRPMEFCLDRRLSGAEQQYGVRSAGSDGTYSAGPYRVGGFPESQLEGDLVWMDGYFIRWPEPQ